MELYLIRHGRQSSALCNVNVDLAKAGIRQAQLLGERLLPAGIDVVYSSDLIRAVETAREANQYWQQEHIIRPELRESDFGDMEGLTEAEIERRYRDFKKEQWKLLSDIPYPNGECGEDVYLRVKPFFDELKVSGYKKVAIVTHGGVIRSFLAGILSLGFEKKLLFAKNLENCSITKLSYDAADDRYYLDKFNDYAHLEAYPELLRINWKK